MTVDPHEKLLGWYPWRRDANHVQTSGLRDSTRGGSYVRSVKSTLLYFGAFRVAIIPEAFVSTTLILIL